MNTDSTGSTICESGVKAKVQVLLAIFFAFLVALATIPAQALAEDTSEQIAVPDGQVQLVNWSRLSGAGRIDTMAAISAEGFDKADTVVVANSGNFPDALSATALAGYYNAPILLTSADTLDSKTASEIERLGAKKVIIAGGEASVSASAESQISQVSGVTSVNRISGTDRFKTSEQIYNAGKSVKAWNKTAIIASGVGFADALSMSPYAYAKGAPIFLADSEGNLTSESAQAITNGGFEQVVIAGGESVVSQTTQSAMENVVGKSNVTRIAGGSRYETSAKIAEWSIENGLSYEGAAFATGNSFPDALTGGALCGSRSSVLMLVSEDELNQADNAYTPVTDALSANKAAVKKANILGGTGVVSTGLYQKLQTATLESTTAQTNQSGEATVANKDLVSVDVVAKYGDKNAPLKGATVKANDDGSYSIALPEDSDVEKVEIMLVDSATGEPVKEGVKVSATNSKGVDRGTVQTAGSTGTVVFKGGAIDFSQAKVDATAKTYNGKEQTTTVEIPGLVEDQDFKVTYQDNKNAGTALLTVEGIGTHTGSKTYSFKINQADITKATIALDDTKLAYNGDTREKAVKSIVLDGLVLNDGTDFTVSKNTGVNAGDYELLIAAKGNYTGNVFKSWTIEKAAIDFTNVKIDETAKVYNGSAITTTIDGMPDELKEGTDYTITYTNNVNAGIARVTIDGVGNYQGSKNGTYMINKADLKDAEVELDSTEFVYNKDNQAPTVKRVVADGRVLTEGTDYNVVCDKQSEVGEGYTLSIEAVADGNYTGSTSKTWSIKPADLDFSKVFLEGVDDCVYDGKAKTPIVSGLDSYTTADYEIEYADNTEAGTATVTITAKGNYTGEKVIEFNIAQVSIKDAKVTLSAESFDYAKDTPRTVTVKNVELDGTTIGQENYTSNGTLTEVNAGTYEVVVEGIGNYKDTVTATWVIYPLNIQNAYTVTLDPAQTPYTGEAIEPEVKGLTGLVKDQDYAVTYSNNVNAAKADATDAPTATIEAISNNYTGTVNKTFEISPVSLEKAEIYLEKAEFDYTGADYTPVVKEVVLDGKVLKEGTDYTLDKDNTKSNAGEYKFTINGTGNYKEDSSATADWKIKSVDNILENVTLDVSADGATYTGKPIEPAVKNIPSEIGDNYTVEYKSNVEVGVATATITTPKADSETKNYTGTKTIEFKIVPADIKDSIVTLDTTDLTYKFDNGAAVEQTKGVTSVKMTAEASPLDADTDYTVSGATQTDAGNYELTVTGTGNYTGTVNVPWSINAAKASIDYVYLKIEGEYTYSGAAYEPGLQDMPEGPVLGKDYEVAYANNVNATTESSKATVTISFKGNYAATDEKVLEFNISQQDIGAARVYLNTTEELVYSKTPQTQDIDEVVLGSKVLVEDTDYTVSGNTNTDANSYTLRVNGTGNYKGLVEKDWSISPAELDLTNVSLDQQQWTYNGLDIKPEVLGLAAGLEKDKDYKVTYENNIEVGIATAIVEGINNYTGKTALGFMINPEGTPKNISLATVVIENTPGGYETTFNARTQTVNAKVTLDGKDLAQDTDYEVVSGSTGFDAGEITYKIQGKNNYTGINDSASWTIKPATLKSVELEANELEYTGEEQTVKIKSVTFSDANITGDSQYYDITNDKATNVIDHTEAKPEIGKNTLTITGKDNYTGTASVDWKITPKSIKDTQPEGKAEIQLNPTELVYDRSEKTQSVDKVILGNKVLTETSEYIVSDNTQSNVNTTGDYTLKVTGTGNYKDEITADWNISPRDISNATLTITDSEHTYSGEEQEPTQVKVTDGTTELKAPTDYTVVEDSSKAEDAGDYTYIIEGAGNYTGATSADWKINKANIEELSFTLDSTPITYDGEAKEPTVTAPTGLELDEDYTVTYSNNVDAAESSAADAPTVTIEGIGNYEGSVKKTFTISPIQLNQDKIEFYLKHTEFVYDEDDKGVAKEFSPTIQRVIFDGKLLTKDIDYTVISGEKGTVGPDSKAPKEFSLTIQGKGNYSSTAFTKWSIISGDAVIDDVTLDVNANGATYTGDEIKPKVLDAERALNYGKIDGYNVKYENNVNVGVATATITFTGNYTGTKIIQYNIVPADLKGYTVNLDATEKDYTGNLLKVNVDSVEGTVEGKTVTVDSKYYDVAGAEETNVARDAQGNVTTYTVTVTGKDNYTGTTAATWTINPAQLKTVKLVDDDLEYTGVAQTVKIASVTDKNDKTVSDNAGNYTVSGDTETDVKRTRDGNVDNYTVTVTGTGNYTGTKTADWKISPVDIKDATVELDADELEFTGQEQQPNVTRVILGNKVLEENTEYTVADEKQTNVAANDGTYNRTVTGTGNYTGTATTTWKITPKSLVGGSIELDKSNLTYDGTDQTVKPSVKDVDSNSLTVNNDYTVDSTSVTTGKEAGDYNIKVTGTGNYKDSIETTWTIAPKDIKDVTITLTDAAYTFDGGEKAPTAEVKDGEASLTSGTDYTVVSGDKGTDADTYTYTIVGKGNYTGNAIKEWKINPAQLKTVKLVDDDLEYTGVAQTVKIDKVKDNQGNEVAEDNYIKEGDITKTDVLRDKDGDVDTYTVTVKPKNGNYTGEASATWEITPVDIEDATVELDASELVYNGEEQEQKVAKVIVNGNKILDSTKDYDVTNNKQTDVKVKDSSVEGDTGTYKLTVSGKGNYTGTQEVDWNITPKDISKATLALDKTSYEFDNEFHLPNATVTDSAIQVESKDKVLAKDTDYKLGDSTTAQIDVDDKGYSYEIVGIGNYQGTKSTTWWITPKATDLSNLALEEQDEGYYIYDGTEKKPGVTGFPEDTSSSESTAASVNNANVANAATTSMVKDKDYTVEYFNNINAGIGIVRVVCQGNYTGDKTLAFQINPKDISGDNTTVTLDAESVSCKVENFSTVSQTNGVKSVTVSGITGALSSADDYTVGGQTNGADPDDYKITVTGKGNFTGTKTATWTITKAELPSEYLPTNVTATGYVGNTVADVTFVEYNDEWGRLVWKDKTESLGTRVDSVTKHATFVPYDYFYESKEVDVTVNVNDKNYTIVYHGNTATSVGLESGGEFTYSQTVSSSTAAVTLEENKFGKSDGTNTYKMTGWNTQADGMGTSYSDHASIEPTDSLVASVQIDGKVDLYAQWLNNDNGNYWIAPAMKSTTSSAAPITNASYTSPTDGVVRTQSLIDEDMKVLHNQAKTNSLGQGRETIANIYQSYSDSDAYHLYTAWKGNDATQSTDDAYVEFRIVQVGEHDWDGSAVTFMATHSLPTAQQMNSTDTNTDGWSASYMRKTVMQNGGYAYNGLANLMSGSSVKAITKKGITGNYEGATPTWTSSTTSDSLWLVSLSELCGEDNSLISSYGEYANEGSQYSWFAGKVDVSETNPALADISSTRSGNTVSDCQDSRSYLRSTNLWSEKEFGEVGSDGCTHFWSGAKAAYKKSVVPCFAF